MLLADSRLPYSLALKIEAICSSVTPDSELFGVITWKPIDLFMVLVGLHEAEGSVSNILTSFIL
jgi:hypothetical protein